MSGGRYVLLGLAHPRSAWFRSVSQWANSAAIPAEFVKVLSAEEFRARLAGGRPFSAALVDATLPSVDRDLIASANDAACPVIIVRDGRVERDWQLLGAGTTLAPDFDRAALLDALSSNARLIQRVEAATTERTLPSAESPWRATIVTVLGPGGAGSSSVAIGVAQSLAADVRYGGSVVLADLCRDADQAMLHDTGSLAPGVQELVEAHRAGRPTAADVRSLTFAIPQRRYDLLLGLRRARFWSTLRPAAFTAALGSLFHAYQAVVLDTDNDLEGEEDGGSLDVEERNLPARLAVSEADVVIAVGAMSMKGLHSLTRLLGDLDEHGVPGRKVVPVLNNASRSPRQRAVYSAAFADLTRWRAERAQLDESVLPSPVFVPTRPIDSVLRDGGQLPDPFVRPLATAMRMVLRPGGVSSAPAFKRSSFTRVTPGSLGTWSGIDSGPEGAT